jgi:hypothetical protein
MAPFLATVPFPMRVLLQGAAFQGGEFCTMLLLRGVWGESPSEREYEGKWDSIMSATRLSYFPAFCVASVGFGLLQVAYCPELFER